MTLIRIQERQADPGGPNAILSFDYGAEYPITICDPFSEKQEQYLEWYFEEWLGFPFLDQVKADAAAKSITSYGENLFNQVFADPESFATYRAAVQAGIGNLQIEIAGSPGFHRLHWEALKDPKLPQPLCLQAPMVRKNVKPQVVQAMTPVSPTINLLIIAARPGGAHDVGYRTITRPLVEMMRNANLPVQINIVRPGTYRALMDQLEKTRTLHPEGYYHVIHFDVHGALLTYEEYSDYQKEQESRYQGEGILMKASYGHGILDPYEGQKAFLFLQGETGADPVEAGQLADLMINYQVPIAILNACQSGKQVGTSETSLGSRLMQAGVQLVLAMGYSVTVSAAKLLMGTLYQQLFQGQDLSTAIRRGRQELYNNKERRAYFDQTIELEDWLLPVVYQNQPQRLQTCEFTSEESNAFYERQAARYIPSRTPEYGFEGRDADILELERLLLTKHNIVLVQGMGGAGKTTLLQHLGSWCQTTGLVDQVFYFGYDEKAWSHQQILHGIAKQLLGEIGYLRDFQPLSPDAQQAMLGQKLRAERHLLMLDNLESITGARLAIQHTLPPEERDALKGLLADLVGGQTLVLLGSRGCEAWLAKGTFGENVFELGGLDPEAASSLANRILKRYKAVKYHQDPDYHRILKLLNGFPLALEVVLANLANHTPIEVLSALQVGDVSLDKDTQDKTTSILRCIEYSYSNLEPELQQLLLCLAPFTSAFWQNNLKHYSTCLRQQPILDGLPFECWPEVVQEAMNWGMLSSDPDNRGFLRLQPTLPYFLGHRLQTPEQAEVRSAVETAFIQLYDQGGYELFHLLNSADPKKRQIGQMSIELEYDNLMTALNLALNAETSIHYLYFALSDYLNVKQELHRGLQLNRYVMDRLSGYSSDKKTGQIIIDLARVHITLAVRHRRLKYYPEAETALKESIKLVSELHQMDDSLFGEAKGVKAKAYHNMGMVAEEQHEFEQAEEYYTQALKINIEINDKKELAGDYHQLGNVAYKQRHFDKAEEYYHQALQILIEINDRLSQATTYLQLGNVAYGQHQFKQAGEHYQKALQIFIEFNDRYSQGKAYLNLGNVAHSQREFIEAKQYYQQALQIFIELNDRLQQADIYHNLGIVTEEQPELDQAEQYYRQALQIYIEFNNRHSQAITYLNLGNVTHKQKINEKDEQYYQQALQIFIELNDSYNQASVYHQLGMVAEEHEQWDTARDNYLRSLEIYVRYKDTFYAGLVLCSLAKLWQINGDTRIPAAVSSIFEETTISEAEDVLRKILLNNTDNSSS